MNEATYTIETAVAPAPTAACCEWTGWSATDEAFFRLVDGALPPAFVAGAGVLLASYDEA
jgi:hypothetical protein